MHVHVAVLGAAEFVFCDGAAMTWIHNINVKTWVFKTQFDHNWDRAIAEAKSDAVTSIHNSVESCLLKVCLMLLHTCAPDLSCHCC